MATKLQLDKLRSRISAAAIRRGWTSASATIEVPAAMDEATVIARHYQLFPRDKGAKQTVIIRRFGPADPDVPPGDHADPRISQAWRGLAREQKQAQPLGFWAAPSENSLMRRS
jgi:hypothetical protein